MVAAMRASPDASTLAALTEIYLKASEAGSATDRSPLQAYHRRRWLRASDFAGWLAASELPALTMERALTLYRASGGNRATDFKANPIEEVRDSLDFLLYDAVKLEGRFSECASEGGAYKLAGAGKEFVSYLMCLRDPTLFAAWNFYAERALRHLGMYPGALRKGDLGLRYLDWLETVHKVRHQLGVADFRAVDEFCYVVTLTSNPPGRRKHGVSG